MKRKMYLGPVSGRGKLAAEHEMNSKSKESKTDVVVRQVLIEACPSACVRSP